MTSRLLLIVTLLVSEHLVGQRSSKELKADSIIVYKGFKEHGTTGGLWHNHRDLLSSNAPVSKLTSSQLDSVLTLFQAVKRKKLFQQKYGGNICHAVSYIGGQRTRLAIFRSRSMSVIDDLDHMHRWVLRDSVKAKQVDDIIRKHWLH